MATTKVAPARKPKVKPAMVGYETAAELLAALRSLMDNGFDDGEDSNDSCQAMIDAILDDVPSWRTRIANGERPGAALTRNFYDLEGVAGEPALKGLKTFRVVVIEDNGPFDESGANYVHEITMLGTPAHFEKVVDAVTFAAELVFEKQIVDDPDRRFGQTFITPSTADGLLKAGLATSGCFTLGSKRAAEPAEAVAS